MSSFSNLRFAFRQLLRTPGFTILAVVTLGLGIGFSASSFSLTNAFLLRTAPYPESDRLVQVFASSPQSPRRGHAPGNVLDLQAMTNSFEEFSLLNFDVYSLGEPGEPAEQVTAIQVGPNFFDALRVQPMLGRAFTPEEATPDQPRVTILTYRAWQRRHGGSPKVLGEEVRLNRQEYTIIGVLPESFDAPLIWGTAEYVTPRVVHPEFKDNRTDNWMNALGRLKPGVTIQQAQTELETITARLREAYPEANEHLGVNVVVLHLAYMDKVSQGLLWLMTVIALAMLLIACANLASLKVARAFARRREFAVRSALGGSQRQLMMPLLSESFLLSIAGGVLGLFVAWWCNGIIGNLLLINGEPGFDVPIDFRVFGFAAAISIFSGLAFGIMPAWFASRTPAAEVLKDGSRSATSGKAQNRLKQALIVTEMAIALALVGVAASFGFGARSFLEREVGWNMRGIYSGFIALPYDQYEDAEKNRAFIDSVLSELQAIPGIEHASLSTALPIGGLSGAIPLVVDGLTPEETENLSTQVARVTAEFFDVIALPLLEGELFREGLTADDPLVAVVNSTLARTLWPNESAVGKRVRLGDQGADQWMRIIGVVGDADGPANFSTPETRFQLFRPLRQQTSRYLTIAARTSVPPENATRSVAEAVARIDSDVPVAQAGSLRERFERNLSNLNIVVLNLGISALMGLLIAGIGLFGVISQLIAQRTRDIGVRVALGALPQDIIRMILAEGTKLLLFGVVIGTPIFYLLTSSLQNVMPEMKLPGMWLYSSNLAVLSATMLAACYVPARRATRISPAHALRAE